MHDICGIDQKSIDDGKVWVVYFKCYSLIFG